MTRIDFYILPESAADGSIAATCRLCDKATSVGHKVYVYTTDATQAESLDGALWSFRQGSFIAHEKHHGQSYEDPQPLVLLGSVEPPETHTNILINLSAEVPPFFSRFQRVLEVVDGDAALRAKSRERFKAYKAQGCELNTFEQNAEGAWAKRA